MLIAFFGVSPKPRRVSIPERRYRIGCIGLLAALLAQALLLAGCLEVHSRISLRPDGTGVEDMEFVVLTRELQALSRGAAEEFEREFKARLSKSREEQLKEGRTVSEITESTDPSGNRVFRVSSEFRSIGEVFGEHAACSFRNEQESAFRTRTRLDCEFKKSLEADLPIAVTIRVRVPGSIESTNGSKQAEDEVLWTYPKGFRRGNRIEVTAIGGAVPSTYVAAGGVTAALLLLGGAWLALRWRRGVAQARNQPAGGVHPIAPLSAVAAQPCESCGTRNEADSRFCRGCGAQLRGSVPSASQVPPPHRMDRTAALCRNCGTDNPVIAKFCRACGAPMDSSVARPTLTRVAFGDLETLGAQRDVGSIHRQSDQGGEMTRFCTSCGAQVAAGVRFCTGCGATLSDAGPPVTRPADAPLPGPKAEPGARAPETVPAVDARSLGRAVDSAPSAPSVPRTGRTFLYVTFGLIAAAAVGGGGYWAWEKKQAAGAEAKRLEEARLAEAKRSQEEAARREEELRKKLKAEEDLRQQAERERKAAEARAAEEARVRQQAELRAAAEADARRQAEVAAVSEARAREQARLAAQETDKRTRSLPPQARGPTGYPAAAAAAGRGDYAAAQSACFGPAQAGDAHCQFMMGVLYAKGQLGSGSPSDLRTAVDWFMRAAQQNLAQAQFNLGLMYEQGAGIPRDLNAARTWYQRAAAQGEPNAALALARLGVARR